jgi:hypothetical protein
VLEVALTSAPQPLPDEEVAEAAAAKAAEVLAALGAVRSH